jgi:hypothetical protein
MVALLSIELGGLRNLGIQVVNCYFQPLFLLNRVYKLAIFVVYLASQLFLKQFTACLNGSFTELR